MKNKLKNSKNKLKSKKKRTRAITTEKSMRIKCQFSQLKVTSVNAALSKKTAMQFCNAK